MIFMLQQQLKEAHEQIARLQQENEQLRTLRMPPDTEPGGSVGGNSSGNTPLHNWSVDASHDSESDLCAASKLLASSSRVGKDGENCSASGNVAKRTSPVLPPALLALSGSRSKICATSSDQASAAQSSEDFSSGTFAFKVTPDSGMQTQEEEDISMDAPDFSTSHNQQQCNPGLHQVHPVTFSAPAAENTGSATVKKELNSAQAGLEKTSVSPSSQKLSFPNNVIDRSSRTSLSANLLSSKSAGDSSPKSSQTRGHSPAGERTTEKTSSPFAICNTEEGDLVTQHRQEPLGVGDMSTGRTNHSLEARYEKTSTLTTIKNEREERMLEEDNLDENKTTLHASLGLNSHIKLEDDRADCQLRMSLVNGNSSLPGQGL